MKTTKPFIMLLIVAGLLAFMLPYAIAYKFHFKWTTAKYQVNAGLTILPSQPVPEFPLGSAMPIAVLPLLFYLWWRRRQKTSP